VFVTLRMRAGRISGRLSFRRRITHEDSRMRNTHRFHSGLAGLAVAICSIASSAAGASPAMAAPGNEIAATATAVIAVDQHWLEAEVGGDTAYLEDLLLPEYRSVGADGVAHPKSAIVAHAAKNRGSDTERRTVEAWIKAHPSGKSVVIHGDTAILSFYDPALGATNGVRSSDIFVRIDGRWHALYSQHSGAGKG
jgi:hypothetical protein